MRRPRNAGGSETTSRARARRFLNVPRARTRGAVAGQTDYPPASRACVRTRVREFSYASRARARETEGCSLADATGIAPAREGRRHG